VNIQRVEPAAYRVFFGPPSPSSSTGGGGSSSSSSSTGPTGSNTGEATSGSGTAGFSHLDLLYDIQKMAQQLEAIEQGAGTEFVSWLAAARRALVVGTENFIARDVENFFELLDLRRLLPLLTQVDVFELLGQHWGRCVVVLV